MSIQIHNGGILTEGGAIAVHADCCCNSDPCDCHDLQCSFCDTDCTPNCFRVTTSGITLCDGCDSNEGDSESREYSFINGFDPNDTFDLPQSTSCLWRLVVADAFRADLYPEEECIGTPTPTDYDVEIRLAKTSDTEATFDMYVDLGGGGRYVLFTDTITVASKHCGAMNFTNDNDTCFELSGGDLLKAVAISGAASAEPCCPA